MKNRLFLWLAFIAAAQMAIAQNQNRVGIALKAFNNDTAQYLKQRIVANKNSYIGKPFDSLLLDLPAANGYIDGVDPRNRNISPHLTLFFSTSTNVHEKLKRREMPAVLIITWATPLNVNEPAHKGIKAAGDWTTAAYYYYKNKIIADVQVVRD